MQYLFLKRHKTIKYDVNNKSFKSLCSTQRHALSRSNEHEWEDEKLAIVTRLSE